MRFAVPNMWVANALTIFNKTESLTPNFKPAKAYWNWLLANYEMRIQKDKIKARPLKLTIDVTNTCQLQCPLCPTGQKWHDRQAAHMNLGTFRQLIDELGDYLFVVDFFNWGEPLLNNQLEEFIHIANSHSIDTSISTNLSIPLSEQRVQKIIESGLNALIISVDGASQSTYETYRRGGKLDLVLENMRQFVEQKRRLGRKNPYLTWRFLVFRFNEEERDQATKIAKQIGIDRILFATPYIDHERFPDWIPKDSKFNRYIKNDSASLREEHQVRTRCDWHYISSAINSDGGVAPCCGTFRKTDDFAQIDYAAGKRYMAVVNNEKFVSIRKRFSGKEDAAVNLICENCPTPDIMNYSNFVNKLILFRTTANILKKIRLLGILQLLNRKLLKSITN